MAQDATGSGSQGQPETAAGEAQAPTGAVSESKVHADLEALVNSAAPTEQPAKEASTEEPEPKDAEDADAEKAEAEAKDDDAEEAEEERKEPSHGEVKRINKLTARAKAAEERAAALEKELAEAKAKPAITPEQVAKLDIPAEYLKADEVKVLEQADTLSKQFAWLKQNRGGYSGPGPNGATVEYSAEQIADLREEVLLKMVAVSPKAEAIRERARAELAADLAQVRQLKARPAASAATVKAKVKPTVTVPTATGISPQSITGTPKRGANLIFENHKGQGEQAAAAAALQALFGPTGG